MSSDAANFGQTFVYRGPQNGRQTGFALSPNGSRLLSATDTGSLVLIDTQLGHPQVGIETCSEITALVWANETQAIFAGSEGHLYSVSFRYAIKVSILNSPG
jgi:hypothetical protein